MLTDTNLTLMRKPHIYHQSHETKLNFQRVNLSVVTKSMFEFKNKLYRH